MATFLDIGLFGYFGAIFPVLLVFLLVFAVLTKTKFFGDNKGVHSLIAFAIAMMVLVSPGVVSVINIMAPWFVFIFIFSMLFLVSLQFLGVKSEAITDYMTGDWSAVHWIILSIAIIIAIGSLATVYGGSLLPYTESGQATVTAGGGVTGTTTSTGDFNQNVGRVLFHPKVIGMVFVLLVATFTIRLMAGRDS